MAGGRFGRWPEDADGQRDDGRDGASSGSGGLFGVPWTPAEDLRPEAGVDEGPAEPWRAAPDAPGAPAPAAAAASATPATPATPPSAGPTPHPVGGPTGPTNRPAPPSEDALVEVVAALWRLPAREVRALLARDPRRRDDILAAAEAFAHELAEVRAGVRRAAAAGRRVPGPGEAYSHAAGAPRYRLSALDD